MCSSDLSHLVSPGGVIAHVGLGDNTDGLDVRRITLQEITFIGTYTYTVQDFKDTAEALFAGAAMFVMERRVGEVIRGIVPRSMRHHDRLGDRIGRALAVAIAEFHSLNPSDVELETLGKPDGFVLRQVEGWKKRSGC